MLERSHTLVLVVLLLLLLGRSLLLAPLLLHLRPFKPGRRLCLSHLLPPRLSLAHDLAVLLLILPLAELRFPLRLVSLVPARVGAAGSRNAEALLGFALPLGRGGVLGSLYGLILRLNIPAFVGPSELPVGRCRVQVRTVGFDPLAALVVHDPVAVAS